jgi:hypothetical protein
VYRERVDDTERERKPDQDDKRSEQLAPARMLAAHEPGREDADDRYKERERSNGRRWIAGQQPIPRAVAEERRDDDDVGEGGDPGRTNRRRRALPTPNAFEDQRKPESGAGAARLDQTSSENGRCGLAALVTTFPQPHDAADATPSATA